MLQLRKVCLVLVCGMSEVRNPFDTVVVAIGCFGSIFLCFDSIIVPRTLHRSSYRKST